MYNIFTSNEMKFSAPLILLQAAPFLMTRETQNRIRDLLIRESYSTHLATRSTQKRDEKIDRKPESVSTSAY